MIRRLAMVSILAACAVVLLAASPVTADSLAAPVNDDYSAAVVLSGEEVTQAGTNTAATIEAGEPATGGAVRQQSVWYRWTAPHSGNAWIDTCAGAAGDTFIGVYTGSELASLAQVGSADEGCSGPAGPSRVQFVATQGVEYAINVAVPGGTGAGDFTLTIATGPMISVGPVVSGSGFVGQPLSITEGTWVGKSPISFTYNWYRFNEDGTFGSTIPSATDSTYIPVAADVGKRMNGNVTAQNAIGSATTGAPLTGVIDFDTDGDMEGDAVDDDDDGDGLDDADEAAKGTDRLRPDTDGDGLIDSFDPCPLNAVYNNRVCGPIAPPSKPSGAETVTITLPRVALKATKAGVVSLKGGAVSTVDGTVGGAASAAYAATGKLIAQVKTKRSRGTKRLTISKIGFAMTGGETRPIEFQLTRAGRAALAKARSLKVTMVITVVAPDGSSLTSERRYVLRAGSPIR